MHTGTNGLDVQKFFMTTADLYVDNDKYEADDVLIENTTPLRWNYEPGKYTKGCDEITITIAYLVGASVDFFNKYNNTKSFDMHFISKSPGTMGDIHYLKGCVLTKFDLHNTPRFCIQATQWSRDKHKAEGYPAATPAPIDPNYSAIDVIAFLRKIEWSMGSGQCPECYGVHTTGCWGIEPKDRGHERDCALAHSLQFFNEPTNWKSK